MKIGIINSDLEIRFRKFFKFPKSAPLSILPKTTDNFLIFYQFSVKALLKISSNILSEIVLINWS